MSGIKAHLISHTHWDREWYKTREEFRVKLVRLIDELLYLIDSVPDFGAFMLDGQTILIEDYLEIKPENKDRLTSAIARGKIICGPWYILPDELLVSGEAHIRNYIMGTKIVEELNGLQDKMDIAYLPDSFGHPQQMPQIIKGLGMDTMVFWRGTADFMKNSEFYWQSPHPASQILCIHLPYGYGNSGRLSQDMDITYQRLKSMMENLADRSTTDNVLLMNGSDHVSCQLDIKSIIKEFNKKSTSYQIRQSTLNDFITDVKAASPELKTYMGEFRYSERSMLLGGTLSTRMPIKQNNHFVQKNMERYIEPMLVLERLLGAKTDLSSYCTYLWKKILENHPHDSICGCSTDPVHKEMLTRFQSVKQIESTMINDAFIRIENLSHEAEGHAEGQLLLFEPTQDKLPSYIEVDIDLDRMLVQEVDYEKSIINDYEADINHPSLPAGLKIEDDAGRTIEHIILTAEKAYYTHYQDETLPEIYKVNRLRVGLLLPAFSFGIHVINVFRNDKKQEIVYQNNTPGISNEFYEIFFENGTFTINEKKSKKIHRGVNRLVDKGDAGDEYTYSWPLNDAVFSLKPSDIRIHRVRTTEICQQIIMEGNLKLPEKLNDDRKSRSSVIITSPVRVTVSLYPGIDQVDFETVIENNSMDHRLQVEFPSGVNTQVSRSSDAFGITERMIALNIPESWAEYPQSTHPTHGFVNLSDKSGGVSAATFGVSEFEAENIKGQSMLRITLLRCVGWLSRTDLITRKGNGGWTIETPDAQCKGRYEFKYSISYHSSSYKESDSFALMEKALHPSILYSMGKSDGSVAFDANPVEFISQLPKDIRLSAFKIAESGKSCILRVFSIGDRDQTIQLEIPSTIKEAYITNLNEKRLRKLPINKSAIRFSVEKSQIVTIELENL